MELGELKARTQGDPTSDVKPPIHNPKVGDVEWRRAREEKRMAKLEASIHAISGKFETYDAETTEPLVDTAMDSIPKYRHGTSSQVGWTRLADRCGTDGVYFANIITNETRWPPEPLSPHTTPLQPPAPPASPHRPLSSLRYPYHHLCMPQCATPYPAMRIPMLPSGTFRFLQLRNNCQKKVKISSSSGGQNDLWASARTELIGKKIEEGEGEGERAKRTM